MATAKRATAIAGTGVSLLTAIGVVMHYGLSVLPIGHAVDRWQWTPPTTGLPAESYVVQVSFVVPDTTARIYVGGVLSYSVRVAGIDSLGRMGETSMPGHRDSLQVNPYWID